MDDANVGALADDSLSTSGSAMPSAVGALSFLSASWVNARLMQVADRANEILERIIDRGLLVDGFAPFESPITDDMLERMRPEQFAALLETEPSEGDKAQLLGRLKGLKLPMPIELPKHPSPIDMRAHPSFAKSPSDNVNSQGSNV